MPYKNKTDKAAWMRRYRAARLARWEAGGFVLDEIKERRRALIKAEKTAWKVLLLLKDLCFDVLCSQIASAIVALQDEVAANDKSYYDELVRKSKIIPIFVCPTHGACSFWYRSDARRVCEMCFPKNSTPARLAIPVSEAHLYGG
jgi:hypothetical protein